MSENVISIENSSSTEVEDEPPRPRNREEAALVPVEIFFGGAWEPQSSRYYARFIVLPRVGEIIEFLEYKPGLYQVMDVRHRSAMPPGGGACVRILVGMIADGDPMSHEYRNH